MLQSDLCIVGGGPAGCKAALDAAAAGLKTVLVEREHLGGTCLNWGCIPTKLLLGAVAPKTEADHLRRLRLVSGNVEVDPAALRKRIQSVLTASRKAMRDRLAAAGVQLIMGQARFTSPNRLRVEGEDNASTEIAFTTALLACGTSPQHIPGLKPDGETILDSNQILDSLPQPASLAVIGAGAIGLEMAEYFHAAGSRIALIEMQDRLAPLEDPDVSRQVLRAAKKRKWEIHTGCRVERAEQTADTVTLHLDSGTAVQAEMVLVAAGRRPNSAGLGLEYTGAEIEGPGWVTVDGYLKAAPNVYAVGDINGRTLLAHAAEDQAAYAVRHLTATTASPYAEMPPPSCVYADPEIMRVGWSVADLQAQGKPVQTAQVPLAANPIAQAHGQTQGLIKTIWSDNRLQGITAVGCRVSHLVTAAEIMVCQGWTKEDIPGYIFAHPTLDESLRDAVLAERTDVS